MKTNLIMVPFAYKLNANTGVNIKRVSKSLDIYLKNCCVSLISARQYQGDDTDCALITNIDIPNFYEKLLTKNGILIYKQDFDAILNGSLLTVPITLDRYYPNSEITDNNELNISISLRKTGVLKL